MHILNHTLDRNVMTADGSYLNAQGLRPLEHYLQTYAIRLETYQQLGNQSQQIVHQTMKKFAQTYPELVQKHGDRCLYDLSEVLRYVALSILRDDEVFFKEQMVSWLDTMLLAHKRNAPCAKVYQYLQETIHTTLPFASDNLIRPYIESVILTLQSHA